MLRVPKNFFISIIYLEIIISNNVNRLFDKVNIVCLRK